MYKWRALLDAAVCFVLRHVFLMSASVVLTQPGYNRSSYPAIS